jgi:hypothetical protein
LFLKCFQQKKNLAQTKKLVVLINNNNYINITLISIGVVVVVVVVVEDVGFEDDFELSSFKVLVEEEEDIFCFMKLYPI